MLNRKYYSFERNNYYYGKLLTSKDFQGEQQYHNDKRRFINRTLHGIGIVSGLNVVMADDSSLVIQSGFALDGAGREIVVEETNVRKLATIEGYAELQSSSAFLGIAYNEEMRDPVYSALGISDEKEGKEFNRIKEGYRLYLVDEKDCVPPENDQKEFITDTLIYEDEEIRITQYLPSFVTKGSQVKMKINIRKKSPAPFAFSLQYDVETVGFATGNFQVKAENILLNRGETYELEYVMIPEDYVFGNQDFQLGMKNLQIQKAERKQNLKLEKKVTLNAVTQDAAAYIISNTCKHAMDAALENTVLEKIWIAKLHLIRSGSSVLIDGVEPPPYDQYVYTAGQMQVQYQLEDFLISDPQVRQWEGESNVIRTDSGSSQAKVSRRNTASGVFELSLSNGGEPSKSYFSGEIMHGLGEGPVFVEVGVEYLNRDTKTKVDSEEVILGDSSIFGNGDGSEEKHYQIDTALRLLPDRGTFVVGVRPKTKLGRCSIRIRWYASRYEDIHQKVEGSKSQAGCIMIQPDTIVLPPKGMKHITPVFINMPEEALSYTLLDPEGGKIDNNGVYTAPTREGVYEVKVACISNPSIFAHVYMIVSQKKSEEGKE